MKLNLRMCTKSFKNDKPLYLLFCPKCDSQIWRKFGKGVYDVFSETTGREITLYKKKDVGLLSIDIALYSAILSAFCCVAGLSKSHLSSCFSFTYFSLMLLSPKENAPNFRRDCLTKHSAVGLVLLYPLHISPQCLQFLPVMPC